MNEFRKRAALDMTRTDDSIEYDILFKEACLKIEKLQSEHPGVF